MSRPTDLDPAVPTRPDPHHRFLALPHPVKIKPSLSIQATISIFGNNFKRSSKCHHIQEYNNFCSAWGIAVGQLLL